VISSVMSYMVRKNAARGQSTDKSLAPGCGRLRLTVPERIASEKAIDLVGRGSHG
jgi:hypothetical protein